MKLPIVLFSLALSFGVQPASAAVGHLVEPRLKLDTRSASDGDGPRVALTFDACSGQTDERILSTLVDNRIPSTIFVTERWLRHNPEAFAIMKAHPDLFEIENHGALHIPAIDRPVLVYGIAAAGSAQAVETEVMGGAQAIVARGGSEPHWFRGATAKYTVSSMDQIRQLGFHIAGYSINGDDGSLLGVTGVEKRYASARDGDVIISHINQPTHSAGAGVAKAIFALKARGFTFVRLDEGSKDGSSDRTN